MSLDPAMANSGLRTLLADVDTHRRDALGLGLRSAGCRVAVAATAEDVVNRIGERPGPHVLLLSQDFPELDGVPMVQVVRRRSGLPMIVLAVDGGGGRAAVAALTFGADDYVAASVEIAELVARIRAIGRRSGMWTGDTPQPAALTVGPVCIDPAAHSVTVDGDLVPLTSKEFDLLRILSSRPGTTFRRDQIARRVWRRNPVGIDHTLDSHIASLRSKLGVRALIKTVRGVGYRVDATADDRPVDPPA